MQTTDIILLISLAWGIGWGFYRGLISQVASLVGIFIALYVSVKYYTPVASLINDHLESRHSKLYISITAFILLFVIMLLLILFLSRFTERITKALHIGSINHLAGAIFGFIKWAFIVSTVLGLLGRFGQELGHPLIDFHETWVYNHLKMIAPVLIPALLESVYA